MVGVSILLATPVAAQAGDEAEGVRGTIVDDDDEPVQGV